MTKNSILSGMRPTGKLHLGHLSVLENWVRLQEEYRCFYFIADWHALTTVFDDPSCIRDNVREIALDWLACGIDPEKSAIFVQSAVKEHAELHLLFSMITPISWLERVPTYKEQLAQFEKKGKDIAMYGFLGYPLLQAADILLYRPYGVPVGEDQLPHLELTREIARRFNHLYKTDIMVEPQALLAKVKLLPGIDGRKMSKSYDNYITLAASPAEIQTQVQQMVTDPARIRKDDPGHPEICMVYQYHCFYNPQESAEVACNCRMGAIGCVACKKKLMAALEAYIAPLREKRAYFASKPHLVQDILAAGNDTARQEAAATLAKVREIMGV